MNFCVHTDHQENCTALKRMLSLRHSVSQAQRRALCGRLLLSPSYTATRTRKVTLFLLLIIPKLWVTSGSFPLEAVDGRVSHLKHQKDGLPVSGGMLHRGFGPGRRKLDQSAPIQCGVRLPQGGRPARVLRRALQSSSARLFFQEKEIYRWPARESLKTMLAVGWTVERTKEGEALVQQRENEKLRSMSQASQVWQRPTLGWSKPRTAGDILPGAPESRTTSREPGDLLGCVFGS